MKSFLKTASVATVTYVISTGYVAAADKAESGSPGLPQLDPASYPSQIFWLILTFTATYLIFSRSILPALSSTIDHRRDRIQTDLEEARKMKDEAHAVFEEYEEALKGARESSSNLFIEAQENIKERLERAQQRSAEKGESRLQNAEFNIEKAKLKALDEVDDIAAEAAVLAAEKIVGISSNKEEAKKTVNNITNQDA